MKASSKKSFQNQVKLSAVRKQSDYIRMLEENHEELELQNQSLRLAQLELESSRDHYVELFDTAPVCFVTLTTTGVIREVNLPAASLLGRWHEPLAGWPFISFIARRDKKSFLAHLAKCRDAANPTQPVSTELRLVNQAGQVPAVIELVSIPTVEADGTVVLKSVFRDISQVKQMLEVHRWLAAIVESTDDAVIGKDLNGKIISCNRGASALFGYAPEELVGQPVTILFPPERLSEEAAILQRIRSGENIEHYETTQRRKDGTLIEVSLTISPIRDAHKKIIGASKIARDITDRKRSERELKESLEREKAANRSKDEFMAALSHELRTPLNPVLLLASEAARNRDLPPQIRADFDTIRKNIELEARLIDDLLDLTRVTHGKLILNWSELDAHDVLRDAGSTVLSEIEQKQIVLGFDLRAGHSTVFADGVRLQQVFWNVLKNAVKFTPEEGKITVNTDVINDRLVVKISDTGIGMTAEETQKVFGAFSQGTHQFGGLGLGLAISRALIELHRGSIRAESAGKGLGATFIIELPLVPAAISAETDAPLEVASSTTSRAARKAHLKILLVEDHEPTRTALTQLLLRRRHKVACAGSLAEARSVLAREKGRFQLLISDIGLPDGSGYDLMREIRKDSPVKGIALTGYGMEQDINRSQAAGFSTHLIKPVRIESLDHALSVAMGV